MEKTRKRLFRCVSDTTQICILSEDQFAELQECYDTLFQATNAAYEYHFVIDNVLAFLDECEITNIRKRSPENFIGVNRCFMNWLASFYSWIEYNERYAKSTFNQLKSKFYDNYLEYRLAYILRKFVTHNVFCLTKIQQDLISGKKTIQIPVSNILEHIKKGDFNDRELNVLTSNTKPYFDAVEIANGFIRMFHTFQEELWVKQKDSLANALNIIYQYVPKEHPIDYNTVVEDDTTRIHIGAILYSSEILLNRFECLVDLFPIYPGAERFT